MTRKQKPETPRHPVPIRTFEGDLRAVILEACAQAGGGNIEGYFDKIVREHPGSKLAQQALRPRSASRRWEAGMDKQPKRHVGGKFPPGVSGNPGGKKRQPDAIPDPIQPENNGRNPDGTFAKGNSANPAGKPKGARHRATILAETLLDGQVEALMQKAISMAMGGDASVMRAVLDRLLPPRRDRPVTVDLPALTTAKDLIAAASALVQSVTSGEITPAEGADLSKLIENIARAIEVAELEERLQKLEASVAKGATP
jgi:hypothetical protein